MWHRDRLFSRNCRSHVNFQSALSEGLNVFKMKITTTLLWLKEEKKEFEFRPWGKDGAGTIKMIYFVFHCIKQVTAFEIIQMPFSNWHCTTCIKTHLSKLHCSRTMWREKGRINFQTGKAILLPVEFLKNSKQF